MKADQGDLRRIQAICDLAASNQDACALITLSVDASVKGSVTVSWSSIALLLDEAKSK